MATNLHENLQRQGSGLHIHNRTESKAKSLVDKGAIWESSPADIAQTCRITFSSLFADDGLKSTFRAWLSGKPEKGSIYVDSSTVYPGTARELTAEAEQAGTESKPYNCAFQYRLMQMLSTLCGVILLAKQLYAGSAMPLRQQQAIKLY